MDNSSKSSKRNQPYSDSSNIDGIQKVAKMKEEDSILKSHTIQTTSDNKLDSKSKKDCLFLTF